MQVMSNVCIHLATIYLDMTCDVIVYIPIGMVKVASFYSLSPKPTVIDVDPPC